MATATTARWLALGLACAQLPGVAAAQYGGGPAPKGSPGVDILNDYPGPRINVAPQAAALPGGNWASIAKLPPIAGHWLMDISDVAHSVVPGHWELPPLKPAQLAATQAYQQAVLKGVKDVPTTDCVAPTYPWVLWFGFNEHIYFFPGGLLLVTPAESVVVRTIVTDGSPHPAVYSDPDSLENMPLPVGDSRGHWEGDTLVNDIIAINPDNLIANGVKIGAGAHATERYRLVSPDVMEVVSVIDAPEVLEHPWTLKRTYHRIAYEPLNTVGYCQNGNPYRLNADGGVSLDLPTPSDTNR